MLQRVMQQIVEVGLDATVTVATGIIQHDPILSQLREIVNIELEPERQDKFPIIALACLYLRKKDTGAMKRLLSCHAILIRIPDIGIVDKFSLIFC